MRQFEPVAPEREFIVVISRNDAGGRQVDDALAPLELDFFKKENPAGFDLKVDLTAGGGNIPDLGAFEEKRLPGGGAHFQQVGKGDGALQPHQPALLFGQQQATTGEI